MSFNLDPPKPFLERISEAFQQSEPSAGQSGTASREESSTTKQHARSFSAPKNDKKTRAPRRKKKPTEVEGPYSLSRRYSSKVL